MNVLPSTLLVTLLLLLELLLELLLNVRAGLAAPPGAVAAAQATAPRYRATLITGRESYWPPVYGGINNAGQIIGNRQGFDEAAPSGFVTMGDRLQRLQAYGGHDTIAIGINNAGQVIGRAGPHAILYEGGQSRALGTLGGAWSLPAAINDAGQIVGLSATASGATHAFLYEGGRMRDLSAAAPYGYVVDPLDINNKGHITGAWHLPHEDRHAFVYDGLQWSDIGTLGGATSIGTRINDSGQIAGSAAIFNDQLRAAFLYTPGEGMREIARGTAIDPAIATDLNASGTALGIGIGNYPLFTFLAGPGGTHYLERLVGGNWTLNGAAFINDHGQISVYGCNGSGDCGLARLDPVPEPATWLMLLGGLALLGWRQRARRPWRSAGMLGIVSGIAAAALPAGAAVAPHYTLTVYVPEEAQAHPTAMNGIGHLAGVWYQSSPWSDTGVPTPYLSTGDKWTDLGQYQARFRAAGINRYDAVAGTAPFGDFNRPRAYLYREGALHPLGTLGGRTSHANAVNDSGQVVGASSPTTASDREHAFVWQHQFMRDLGSPGSAASSSDAIDINNRAQIAGNWFEPGGPTRAFLYEDGRMRDLDTLGGDSAMVSALSQAGHVLGVSSGPDGRLYNFVFYNGGMAALAPAEPFMRARDINSAGDAVGAQYIWSGGLRHDLNSLVAQGWSVRDAVAINDHGQIAAVGCLQGQCNAVVLAPVPEPQVAGLLLAGLPLLGWVAWRRARFRDSACTRSCRHS